MNTFIVTIERKKNRYGLNGDETVRKTESFVSFCGVIKFFNEANLQTWLSSSIEIFIVHGVFFFHYLFDPIIAKD